MNIITLALNVMDRNMLRREIKMNWFKRCKHEWKEVNRYYGDWKGLFDGGLLTKIVSHCPKCDKYEEREIPGPIKEG